MKVFIIICSCFLALIMILLLLIIFLRLKFKILIDNELIRVYLWKFKVFDSLEEEKPTKTKKHKKVKSNKKESNFEKKYKNIKFVINFIRKLLDDKHDDFIYIIKYIGKTFKIKNLDLSFEYGFGDAAVTGVFGGVIWGFISNLSAFINRFIDINKFTNIAITPRYTEQVFDYKVNFVFYVRILNLLKTLKHIKRFKKTLEGRD